MLMGQSNGSDWWVRPVGTLMGQTRGVRAMGQTSWFHKCVTAVGQSEVLDQWVRPMGCTDGSCQWVRAVGQTGG